MNRVSYIFKYTEYLIRKCRAFFITDLYYHTAILNKVSGRRANLRAPETLNEKICHRLVFDHNNLYTLLADKIAVREYVQVRTQRVKTVPLIAIYNRVDDIDFNKLPGKFVLKCNHDSGSAVICSDRRKFNLVKALHKLKLALKKNMYYTTREWQYKSIKPVILCEKYIDLFTGEIKRSTPEMLRIHCFHSVARFIEADFTDEKGNEFINVYDSSWNLQPFQMEYPNTPDEIQQPYLLHNAVTAAQELAQEIDYCRVDLMLKGGEIYFSEITLSPKRGKLKITPAIWDIKLGEMWHLSLAKQVK